jgi:hypothetical protein
MQKSQNVLVVFTGSENAELIYKVIKILINFYEIFQKKFQTKILMIIPLLKKIFSINNFY